MNTDERAAHDCRLGKQGQTSENRHAEVVHGALEQQYAAGVVLVLRVVGEDEGLPQGNCDAGRHEPPKRYQQRNRKICC